MSGEYRPLPWQVPPPGGVHRPVTVQIDVVLPRDADKADTSALMRVSENIVAHNSSSIDRFLSANRQQAALSGQEYADRRIQLDGVIARWRINHGYEKLDLEVFPTGGGVGGTSTSDTNLDGYVCWVHGDPGYPDPIFGGQSGSPGPYNILFNGYLIAQNYKPAGPVGGYPITFGKTAMLCDNYVDEAEHIDIGKSYKRPFKTVPPHGWGSYTAGSSPTGRQQKAYPKIFGYWILDWMNVLNPCGYIFTAGQWQSWDTMAQFAGRLGPPVFDKGMYFKDAQKSPLKPKGMNGMSAILSPLAKGAQEILTIDVFIAEFYDRGAYRKAQQSWTISMAPRQTVAMNDKPMLFGTGSAIVFSDGGGIQFDLNPAETKKFKDSNSGVGGDQLGPHDGLQGGGGSLDGLSDDQKNEYAAWVTRVLAASADWDKKIANQVQAWKDKWNSTDNMKLLNQSRNVRAWLFPLQDASGNKIPNTDTENPLDRAHATGAHPPTQEYGPIQEYWWDWNTPQGSGVTKITQRWAAFFSVIHQRVEFIDTRGNPDNPKAIDFGGSFAGPANPVSHDALYTWAVGYVKTDAVQQQLKEYHDIIGQKSPEEEKPPNLGTDLGDFAHGNIDIAGTSWSFEQ